MPVLAAIAQQADQQQAAPPQLLWWWSVRIGARASCSAHAILLLPASPAMTTATTTVASRGVASSM